MSQKPLGAQLKKARLARGETLEAAAQALRIAPRFLQALETDDWLSLPGRAYALGFLRSYATYLGLDAATLAGHLSGAIDPRKALRGGRLQMDEEDAPRPSVRILLVSLVLAVLIALLWQASRGPDAPPSITAPDAL